MTTERIGPDGIRSDTPIARALWDLAERSTTVSSGIARDALTAKRGEWYDDYIRRGIYPSHVGQVLQAIDRAFKLAGKSGFAPLLEAVAKDTPGWGTRESRIDNIDSKMHFPDHKTLERSAKKYKKKGKVRGYSATRDRGHTELLASLVHPDVLPAFHVEILDKAKYFRAHCGYDNVIRMDDPTRPNGPSDASWRNTLWHEIGHAIEHDSSGITEAANALRDERAKGQKIKKLKNIYKGRRFDDHEVTYEDNWTNAYTGKWYAHLGSTEILAMGLQYLEKDPAEFARRDWQHFSFTIAAITGQFGKRDRDKHADWDKKHGVGGEEKP